MVKNQIVIFSGVKNDGDIDTFDDDIGGEMTSGEPWRDLISRASLHLCYGCYGEIHAAMKLSQSQFYCFNL